MRSTVWLLLTLTLASTAGCASKPAGDFCSTNEAYRPKQGEVYSEENKRKIIAFNEFGEERCGWKP